MNLENANNLVGGERVNNIYDDGILIIPNPPKNIIHNDKLMIYCIKECDNGNVLWRAYYPEEIDLVQTTKKCVCDFYKTIIVRGCQCGGK